MEGTRVTVVRTGAGHDFSIRTPGTPPRWREYEAEMEAAWKVGATRFRQNGETVTLCAHEGLGRRI